MVKILCNGKLGRKAIEGLCRGFSDHEKRCFDPEENLLDTHDFRRQRLFNKDRDAEI